MNFDKNAFFVKHKSNICFLIGVSVFLIVVFLIVAPTKTITNNVEVAYTDTETYYEKEPYEVQEAYQEQEPYQSVETYTDSVPVPVSVPYQDTEYYYQSADAPAGKYWPDASITSNCVCSNRDWLSHCIQLYCQYSRSVTKYRTEMQQQSIQKERPVTKYRTITKYRTVTKYRDVAKTREVMKTRIESRPLEVNWLIGFKTPYKLHLPFISGA